MHADAFTIGREITFAPGKYAPSSAAGRELLTHELVHVLQQRGVSHSVGGTVPIEAPHGAAEREADRITRDPSPGKRPLQRLTTPRVQRRLQLTNGRLGHFPRFARLVNAFLPPGVRFELRYLPFSTGTQLYPGSSPADFDPGASGALSGEPVPGAEPWQVAFHRVLVRIIGAEATTFFDPTTNIVAFGDSFVDGAIDIEDLERLPPRIGAGMLAHALDESLGAPLPRDARIVAYPMRHVLAVHTAERAVVGGLRLETGIRVDPPWVSDLTPDPNSRSTLWIPYLMDDGTLEVVLVQREGHRVVGSSIRHFSSLQSYLLAAPARMLR